MSYVTLVRPALAALALAFAWSGVSTALAADVTPPPPVVVGAAPVSVGDPGCATCQGGSVGQKCPHGLLKSKCNTCGKLLTGFMHKSPNPYPVTLCPGACFGYFQTQWRKWDEVCPYPYQGIGVSDAGRLPGSGTTAPPAPGGLNPPRTVDPKMADPKKTGSLDLLPIPAAPVANRYGQ